MTRPVTGVVVAHEDLAEALVRAVEGISGVEGALRAVSNVDCTPEELQRRIRSAGEGPMLVFVDMASGSCAFAGRKVAGAEGGRVAVVTGVSLPMLLDFVFHRDMELESLSQRVLRKGRDAAAVHLPSREGARDD